MGFIDNPLGGAVSALLIGLLLGLERERSHKAEEELFAGIRTFPILALAGYLGAWAAERNAPLALPAVLLSVGALSVAAFLRGGEQRSGATTEAAALLTPLLGALVAWKEPLVAAALAVLVTLLLTLKGRLHALAGNVSEDEIVAILKFGIVSVVLLPILPTQPIGPYAAIVPRHIGWVVVLISGVSLVGYLLVRLLGGKAGWALAGALGGLVSSTAVTLSFSGKARSSPSLARPLAAGVILASTVLYVRAAVLIAFFDRELAVRLAPRMGALALTGALFALVQLRGGRTERGDLGLGNPVELGRAAGLAVLFAAILVTARAAQAELGSQGLQVAGLVGGLVDVDSVTLAVARLKQQGLAPLDVATRTCLLATLANLLFKAGTVGLVGRRALAARVLPGFATMGVLTAVLAFA